MQSYAVANGMMMDDKHLLMMLMNDAGYNNIDHDGC